jgi:acetolactate synthase I/II/III large subunit
MKCKEYFTNLLAGYGVDEIFGVPGGVILDFLESAEDNLNPCLVFHEQSAVFSAIGYSRAKNSLGVVFATRGPGITNTLTSVADAYYDSVPVLILTGHSGDLPPEGIRTLLDQEIDTVNLFHSVTKRSIRVDTPEQFVAVAEPLIKLALEGRPGPVLFDVKSSIWNQETPSFILNDEDAHKTSKYLDAGLSEIGRELSLSERPILFLGDGFRGKEESIKRILTFANSYDIPILSSRFSQDLFSQSDNYFGFIGSHGLRSGNFILSKADLVVSIGNRMHYPVDSKSWIPLMEKLKVLRFDIDEGEFKRSIPNSKNFVADLDQLCNRLSEIKFSKGFLDWNSVCNNLSNELQKYDASEPIPLIAEVFNLCSNFAGIVSDVGNHEFWVARAYFQSHSSVKLIFSKSFGAMGSAIGKSIGFAHASGKQVLCFAGDQGLMMNIQELHYIAHHQLPIKIFLMNNMSSGMIRSRQKDSDRKIYLTTVESGYSVPDFMKIANSFGIASYSFDGHNTKISDLELILIKPGAVLIELITSPEFEGRPHLPMGSSPTNLSPDIPRDVQDYLEGL